MKSRWPLTLSLLLCSSFIDEYNPNLAAAFGVGFMGRGIVSNEKSLYTLSQRSKREYVLFSTKNGGDNEGSARRVRPNFGDLFTGMPSMSEILGDPAGKEAVGGGTPAMERATAKNKDESWFNEERQRIEEKYRDTLNNMIRDLDEQRKEDPEGTPPNSQAMLEDVLQQEMDLEIRRRREELSVQMIEEYQSEKMDKFESTDFTGVNTKLVDNLLEQDLEEYDRQRNAQVELERFLKYQQDMENTFSKSQASPLTDPVPGDGVDMDQWVLERLEDMANRRDSGNVADYSVSDILEENIEDLRQRMQKEASQQGKVQPSSMKEWQMYRAIASRLQQSSGTQQTEDSNDSEFEQKVWQRLEEWKDYTVKEDQIREQSGLARGPKLPFDWHEARLDEQRRMKELRFASKDSRSKADVRRELNKMSIDALEKLIETSDKSRRERLVKQLETLKQNFEDNDYLDVPEAYLMETEEVQVGAVKIDADFFSSNREGDETPVQTSGQDKYDLSAMGFQQKDESEVISPPETPFFSGPQDDTVDEIKPPPNTPFFNEDEMTAEEEIAETTYSLGSGDEQKLRAMYQRAGARTKAEQEAIRKQWEEFKALEQSSRDGSGLSGAETEDVTDQSSLKYDMSEVLKGDGDFDADKILASIGPRPTRTKKAPPSSPGTEAPSDKEVDSNNIQSSLRKEEIADSLYRAVSAVGGGRTKDNPEAREGEQAAYNEFLKKEEELRSALDSIDREAKEEVSQLGRTLDIDEYAEDALSQLGPRPERNRGTKRDLSRLEDEKALSDQATQNDEENTDDESSDDFVPGWLRKERESMQGKKQRGAFIGSDIDDVFEDDKYEHNMRQLAEYERRRSGKKKQIGIDISDVLRRSTDDYADYNYDKRGVSGGGGLSEAGFISRKKNLLEYTELEVTELNSIMDHREAISGVSPYLSRINKPFKEFGAIFRLEGVLIDTTGFEYEAWKKVATEHGYREPTLEEARKASVCPPLVAITEVFYWTNDVLQCRTLVSAHEKALHKIFADWKKKFSISDPTFSNEDVESVEAPKVDSTGSSVSEIYEKVSALPEDEKFKLLADAWVRTAVQHRLGNPSLEQIMATTDMSPNIAIQQVFRWSDDLSLVDVYVSSYFSIMRELLGIPDPSVTEDQTESESRKVLDQTAMLELQFQVWSNIAGANGFQTPLPNEVLAASVLNDPLIAILEGFGWTDDPAVAQSLASDFGRSLDQLINGFLDGGSKEESRKASQDETPENEKSGSSPRVKRKKSVAVAGPSHDELLEMHRYAWATTALNHGFDSPSSEQVLQAMEKDPLVAMTDVFDWVSSIDTLQSALSTYMSAMGNIQQIYVLKYGTKPEEWEMQPKVSTAPQKKRKSEPTGPTDDEVFTAALNSWQAVAKRKGYAFPDYEMVQFAFVVGPVEAIINAFEWTDDRMEAEDIFEMYKKELKRYRSKWSGRSAREEKPKTVDEMPMYTVKSGADEWIGSLRDVDMKCALVSNLPEDVADVLLQEAGLAHLFSKEKRISAGNGYKRLSDQLLGGALRLEKRPDHCVVFDSSPQAAVAAQSVEMRSVSMVGSFPRYDLLVSDTTSSSFTELTAMNIRRLFGERIYDQPQLDVQKTDPSMKQQYRTKTKYFWDDD